MQSGEPGLPNISVTLTTEDSEGDILSTSTVTTDANGHYQFQPSSDTELYQIFVSIPAADEATIENVSGSGIDSNIDSLGYSSLFAFSGSAVVNAGLVTSTEPAVLKADPSNQCNCGCPNEEGDLLQDDGETEAPDDPSESSVQGKRDSVDLPLIGA